MSERALMGEARMKALLDIALKHSPADQTEVGIYSGNWALTRFANSTIHQNMAGENVGMHVRAVFGKKVATASSNVIDEVGVKALVDRAVNMARSTDENKDFVSLPEPMPARGTGESYSPETAACTPEERAKMAGDLIARADKVNGTAAGSLSVGAGEHAVANSLGVSSYYKSTHANLVTVVTGPDGGFGYAEGVSSDLADIDAAAIGEEASKVAYESRNPSSFEPGEYECILTPYAAATMFGFLMWMGFGALAYQEERSCLVGKLGKKIVDSSVSLWDDAQDPRTMMVPYDSEGVPKQRVDLIKNGVATELFYDSYSAHKVGKKSTGHAGGGLRLIVEPGSASVADMIASTKRGILVTRFHYTNISHLMTASFTGMTRDGTFLIEDGKVVRPVKNLRFTQSILEALSNVDAIGSELKTVDGYLVPAIKIGKWRFNSATEF